MEKESGISERHLYASSHLKNLKKKIIFKPQI